MTTNKLRDRNLTRQELETLINFNEEDSTADIFTYNGKWQKRIEGMGFKPLKINDCDGREYRLPKNLIAMPRLKRQLSDETKAALTKRMKELAAKRVS